MDYTEDITVLSLCAGYGGIELGLSAALENPMRIIAVEIEAFALANLVAKTEAGRLAIEALWPDLRTFPARRFRGCFDIITAGYPCQPFSVAGKRQGADDPRHLWPYIARIIEAVRPVWFFGENVSGHLTLGFPEVYRSLRNMGYTVEAGLFTAAECGAPHRRERLFILANNTGIKYRERCRNEQNKNETFESRGQADGWDKKFESSSSGTSELANTKLPRLHQRKINQEGQTARYCPQNWPSRPGQPQYEWEEPRVVGNARSKKRTRLSNSKRQKVSSLGQTSKRQAQSSLGLSTDGSRNRVDELGLLGNGVVPQQAEKAFRYLLENLK